MAQDYSALTVKLLKAELENRGIEIKGLKLKKDYIERLQLDDREKTKDVPAADEAEDVVQDDDQIQEAGDENNSQIQKEEALRVEAEQARDEKLEEEAPEPAGEQRADLDAPIAEQPVAKEQTPEQPVPKDEVLEQSAPEEPAPEQPALKEPAPEEPSFQEPEPAPARSASERIATIEADSKPTSDDKQGTSPLSSDIEANKRKRRSKTPTPDEAAVARKKLRTETELAPDVVMREDVPPAIEGEHEEDHEQDHVEADAATPSRHRPTRAIYIRNLQRPLQPNALRQHLASFSNSKELRPIEAFHLDSIRTHAFVLFHDKISAQRARNALHDQVWPQERDRRPLFVDFIPEDRVADWIDIETRDEEANGRGRGKRWAVFYEDNADSSVSAELREENTRQPARQQDTAPAPSLPRPKAAPTRAETEETPQFVTLDSLFRSTVEKPKLYFLPVSRDRAVRRLDALDDATSRRGQGFAGGAAAGHKMRYTFEDGDRLVSDGPEFGLRRNTGAARGAYGGAPRAGRGRW